MVDWCFLLFFFERQRYTLFVIRKRVFSPIEKMCNIIRIEPNKEGDICLYTLFLMSCSVLLHWDSVTIPRTVRDAESPATSPWFRHQQIRAICVIRGCFVFRGITFSGLPYLPPVPRADARCLLRPPYCGVTSCRLVRG